MLYPLNSQVAKFLYYSGTDPQDEGRLESITNLVGATVLSQFNYQYDARGRIVDWTRQFASIATNFYQLQYDSVSQVVGAILSTNTPASPGALIQQYAYAYDKAGNRSIVTMNSGGSTVSAFNNLNQLTVRSPSEETTFSGHVTPNTGTLSSVTINGAPATITSGTNFSGIASYNKASNTVTIVAQNSVGGANHQRLYHDVDLDLGQFFDQ